jgi:hypothetical protein
MSKRDREREAAREQIAAVCFFIIIVYLIAAFVQQAYAWVLGVVQ